MLRFLPVSMVLPKFFPVFCFLIHTRKIYISNQRDYFHCRLEYFSVTFNILLALIYLFTDGFRLICWHIPERDDFTFRVCVSLKLLLWSFVFLNLLPFNFLIPTLYGRKFHLWLNLFFLLWYGSCVWNSVSVLCKF